MHDKDCNWRQAGVNGGSGSAQAATTQHHLGDRNHRMVQPQSMQQNGMLVLTYHMWLDPCLFVMGRMLWILFIVNYGAL